MKLCILAETLVLPPILPNYALLIPRWCVSPPPHLGSHPMKLSRKPRGELAPKNSGLSEERVYLSPRQQNERRSLNAGYGHAHPEC